MIPLLSFQLTDLDFVKGGVIGHVERHLVLADARIAYFFVSFGITMKVYVILEEGSCVISMPYWDPQYHMYSRRR